MPHNYAKKVPGEDPRDFDTTSCTQSAYKDRIHRDYAAHFFRWGFTQRFIRNGMMVLDIGCGSDQPVPRTLTDKMSAVPKQYVGVDFDAVKQRNHFAWIDIIPSFDFTKSWKTLLTKYGQFDVLVSLEVIEHMHKASGRKLLRGAHALMKDDGVFLLSTPCYDGRRMAKNHIHEYWIKELETEIVKAGFVVEGRYGTFMDVKELKKATPEHRKVAAELSKYYSNEIISCFLAPLYPDVSRNNIWVLRKPQ